METIEVYTCEGLVTVYVADLASEVAYDYDEQRWLTGAAAVIYSTQQRYLDAAEAADSTVRA